ncbi:hypothetical protein CONCODRAFT_10093 [Conidiobolus coronatus NRRL 28638]|uniref:Extracellular membrane protein CFEM domain-containing protein n=1 Tax=Conidiobolus coronatus (strain ATCC 28846 / CBS 209.66 / NRRL 28638) TaxID=796925 RepID=A0A137NYL6_CONC2|nr:hypothetical protein CONCODRAFT_10093 [Conidiobolus coronatus NRRL 28638]|eukprot:KXN67768.1 hypothetical protein CONCODRAFT_10093 [Conidiobolus coronatus NRRL 28638]
MKLAILLSLTSVVSASSAKCFFRGYWKPELSNKMTELCCFESGKGYIDENGCCANLEKKGEIVFKTCCFFKGGSAERLSNSNGYPI